MPAHSFEKLALKLQAAGAAPSVVERICEELSDHMAEAEAEGVARGLSVSAARAEAVALLGSADSIVAEVAGRPELLEWRRRWPFAARCLHAIASCGMLPAMPFVYCASHPVWLARWGLSSGIAVCVTAGLLLGMQSLVGAFPVQP